MYVIVTDTLDERMYLAWQPNVWDDGYFWTHIEVLKDVKQYNTAEHRFMFKSHYDAINTMHKIDIPKSWKAHVIQLQTKALA